MRVLRTVALVGLLIASRVADAQIFDTGIGDFTTFRTATLGPGQGVNASLTQSISSFGFYAGVTNAATNLKFQIWNSANSSILFEQIKTYGPLASGTLVTTNAMSFTLNSGNTYYFALLGDNNYNVSAFFSPIAFSQNGISLVNPNTNYGPYASPAFMGSAAASIALRINGPGTTVPEPGSIALLGAGLVGLAGVAVRRNRARV